mgnify:CR=1 FL=1
MAEIGIDISAHTSKHMEESVEKDVETVITACGNAGHACPMFRGKVNRHHWDFDDPAHAPAPRSIVSSTPTPLDARMKPRPHLHIQSLRCFRPRPPIPMWRE